MDMLERLTEASRARLRACRLELPLSGLMCLCDGLPKPGFAFEKALAAPGLSFICEVKKASPSKGVIAESFPYVDIALEYEAGGADCLSVLTEPEYFLGSDACLEEIARAVSLPVLRKDFTVDLYQVYQARLLGAGAVLLICAALPAHRLAECMDAAEGLGISALVEVRDERELETAVSLGARLVGANNRDLRTFEVDMGNSLRLRQLAPPGTIFVAESGIGGRGDVEALERGGVDAVLVGESLMRRADRRAALMELRGACGGGP
ncbi:MAG: indole-3-glycerol phosphate synthase TrpC [Clostridiales Family XIII bacterium]|jgi:indole-3-glycerol phosphate synthase|nr:indole-3-glycerol phosphate synthase TrpC [Clostridiales Family XIII bacterium]